MGPTPPPKPPELALRIACDTAARIDVDLAALVPAVRRSLRRSAGRRDWIETETLALDALDALVELWDAELAESCRLALTDVHDVSLVQTTKIAEASSALEGEGRDSWIAQAVLHDLAVRLAWNVCDEEGLLVR
ncbi:MAG TPA: hypothetical protein VLJ76_09830 [Gaiellaceae bacterium]|nr:hypothetical protein [Gaiellaceae bacterium]